MKSVKFSVTLCFQASGYDSYRQWIKITKWQAKVEFSLNFNFGCWRCKSILKITDLVFIWSYFSPSAMCQFVIKIESPCSTKADRSTQLRLQIGCRVVGVVCYRHLPDGRRAVDARRSVANVENFIPFKHLSQ